MGLAAWWSCRGAWGHLPAVYRDTVFAHFGTFNHKLAIPIVLIKQPDCGTAAWIRIFR